MERSLFIVTHWAKEASPNWVWRMFVLAHEPSEALRAAITRHTWEGNGQLHVSGVHPDEFMIAESSQ